MIPVTGNEPNVVDTTLDDVIDEVGDRWDTARSPGDLRASRAAGTGSANVLAVLLDGQAGEFERRFAALREEHLRKPSLIARFDRAGLTA